MLKVCFDWCIANRGCQRLDQCTTLSSTPVPDREIVEPHRFSFSRKCGASVALECERYKKTKARMEAASFLIVPKRTPAKAVPECLRGQSSTVAKRNPFEAKTTWPGPLEVGETSRSVHAFHSENESDRGFDANHARNPREHVFIREMEDYLTRGQRILVEVEELEAYLLCQTDVTVLSMSWPSMRANQKGHRRCAFVKRKEGHMVADMRQYAILRERQETDNKELKEIIEHMGVKQRGLLATVERKQKLNSGATHPGSLGLRQDLGGGC